MGRAKKRTTSSSLTIVEKPESSVKVTKTLSRGQRKRLQRKDQFIKKAAFVAATLKAKSITPFDTAGLQLSLDVEAAKSKKKEPDFVQGAGKLSAKQRKHLVVRELGQLQAVQAHPRFQLNGLQTLQEHLRNALNIPKNA